MEEKKLTDDTDIDVGMIVKALECMAGITQRDCDKCPFMIDKFCSDTELAKAMLDLIHRLQSENAEQKAEIERLTEENAQRREMMCRMDCNYATEICKNAELQADIKQLTKDFEIQRDKKVEYFNKCAELQKQVDKAWFEVGKMCMEERKDTAKDIYKGLCKKWDKMKDAILLNGESENLKDLISEIIGVEVE